MKNKKYNIHKNVKCNCGHRSKDHHNGEGWCHSSTHENPGQCGCTFFYPNDSYIIQKNKIKLKRGIMKKEKFVVRLFDMSTCSVDA